MGAHSAPQTFVNILNIEDVQASLNQDSFMSDHDPTVNTSEFLEPIAADEAYMQMLQDKDLGEEIARLVNYKLDPEGHTSELPPRKMHARSYHNPPSVDAYAASNEEIEALAAKSYRLSADVMHAVPVGLWHYEKCDTTCVFCYEQLMGPCHKCLVGETGASTCKVAIGRCGHPIHTDCQNAWSGKKKCMTCQQDWSVRAEHSVYGDGVAI